MKLGAGSNEDLSRLWRFKFSIKTAELTSSGRKVCGKEAAAIFLNLPHLFVLVVSKSILGAEAIGRQLNARLEHLNATASQR